MVKGRWRNPIQRFATDPAKVFCTYLAMENFNESLAMNPASGEATYYRGLIGICRCHGLLICIANKCFTSLTPSGHAPSPAFIGCKNIYENLVKRVDSRVIWSEGCLIRLQCTLLIVEREFVFIDLCNQADPTQGINGRSRSVNFRRGKRKRICLGDRPV